MRRGLAAFFVLLGAGALVLPVLAAVKPHRPPNVNYALFCMGCHTHEGEGSLLGRIPQLKDAVGHFARLPEGRRYVANVPGVVNAELGPEDTATLLNWMMTTYGGVSRPEAFEPFTGREVEGHWTNAPADIFALRSKARALLAAQGHAVVPYP
ncbi:MAG: hypothetical protein AB7S41_20520 [Parvibaculaceae bacterium]